MNVTVATPLAFVVEVGEPNEPPAPVFDHVTVLPATPVGVSFWSASCAVIVTLPPAVGV